MQDYDTIKQMDSLEAKRNAYGTSPMPQGGSDSHRAGSRSSQRQGDAALAEAIKKNRSKDDLGNKEQDDITAKMTLEMQEASDIKPMDRAQATASHNAGLFASRRAIWGDERQYSRSRVMKCDFTEPRFDLRDH